jgi:two-component SAPR family response regulator
VGRIKVLELVAILASHPRGLDRFELQQRLFPETDQRNGGNHFRQIAHKLKQSAGITLDRRANSVVLSASVSVVAVDAEFEKIIELASYATGHERADQLQAALSLVSGPYLESSVLSWVEERRNSLDLVREEAGLELARLLLQLDRHPEARSACEKVLAVNKYADGAYRILMQIERRVGSESAALAVFRRARESLNELGLRPGDAAGLLSPAKVRTPWRGNGGSAGRRPATGNALSNGKRTLWWNGF